MNQPEACPEGGLAGLYDTKTFALRVPLPAGMTPLAASPDGRHLAVTSATRPVQVWDPGASREQLRAVGLDWNDP